MGGLISRYTRYGSHLFECFDDPRIPATTNELEGFFGDAKRALRATLGCGSTTNSVVSNLGADALIAFHQLRRPGAIDAIVDSSPTVAAFVAARRDVDDVEQPAVRRRSRVRNLDDHLNRLRARWTTQPTGPDP